MYKSITKLFHRHPLASNCAAYAAFSGSAELIQQRFEFKKEDKKVTCAVMNITFGRCQLTVRYMQEHDIKAIGRFGFLGGVVLGPTLYAWYQFLDKWVPGTSRAVIGTKIVLDVFCLGKLLQN